MLTGYSFRHVGLDGQNGPARKNKIWPEHGTPCHYRTNQLDQRARSSSNVGSRYLCGSKSRVRTPAALLGAERARSAGIRLQRQCQKMDCAFRIRREYRTGQTKSHDVRRGLPETGREPAAAAIEVEG